MLINTPSSLLSSQMIPFLCHYTSNRSNWKSTNKKIIATDKKTNHEYIWNGSCHFSIKVELLIDKKGNFWIRCVDHENIERTRAQAREAGKNKRGKNQTSWKIMVKANGQISIGHSEKTFLLHCDQAGNRSRSFEARFVNVAWLLH